MRRFATLLRIGACLTPLISFAAAADELGIEVTKAVDCSRKTRNGDKISVHYNGTLESDGSQFDSSQRGGVPFTFKLGEGYVIQGWDLGLLDMCIGERRTLTIPARLGYGSSGSGPIPGGATLIFETELIAVEGVKAETLVPQRPTIVEAVPLPPRPTIVRPGDQAASESLASDSSTVSPLPSSPDATATFAPTPIDAGAAVAMPTAQDNSPMDNNDNECHLLGPYALIVQAALGLLAVTSLVVKRWRESPRRPLNIWFFDVSKQVFGTAMLHVANIMMSMFSSGNFDVANTPASAAAVDDDDQPNPCSFYLLNITIDTTIGIPILVLLLKVLHYLFLRTPLASPPESIRSGNYGTPPHKTWWLKQSLIYFLGLFGMKMVVFFLFSLLPWIAWVGDWALRWTEGNEALQITFVMFVFPLIMNALQYWIIDGFIKDKGAGAREGGYEGVGGEEDDDEVGGEGGDEEWLDRHRRARRSGEGSDAGDEELEEANPTVLPVRNDRGSEAGKGRAGTEREYDPRTDGEER